MSSESDEDVGPALPTTMLAEKSHTVSGREQGVSSTEAEAGSRERLLGGVKRPREENQTGQGTQQQNGTRPGDRPGKVRRVTPRVKEKSLSESLLASLPMAEMYEKSYMHKDVVSHVCVSSETHFLLTASADGSLKFWRKNPESIEFVKSLTAHSGAIVDMKLSRDGKNLCSIGADHFVKFYDVLNFDMVFMRKLLFTPKFCAWASLPGTARQIVAVSESSTGTIHIVSSSSTFPTEMSGKDAVQVKVHGDIPVAAMAMNPTSGVMISIDEKGIIEYWSSAAGLFPSQSVHFSSKLDTDLFAVTRSQSLPVALCVSPKGTQFAVAAEDETIWVFKFRNGRLRRRFDSKSRADFPGRGRISKGVVYSADCVCFDASGECVLHATDTGVKIWHVSSRRLLHTIGAVESTERFMQIALYQGIPVLDSQRRAAGSEFSKAINENIIPKLDPTLFCTSVDKPRFFIFSTREPDDEDGAQRDVFNEKVNALVPAGATDTRETAPQENAKISRASQIVMHTTRGDIGLQLFPEHCPRTVENFCTHAVKGYYDQCVFHRVIKNFMIQTGDPQGDGTGGESIWGGEFEDEIHPFLKHDRAGTLSMANSGKNTNGSQFFITTNVCNWLDSKHTVFGRVTDGMDVVKNIESVQTDGGDRPCEDIRIVSFSL